MWVSVYRIELDNGDGPHRGEDNTASKKLSYIHYWTSDTLENHPAPYEDYSLGEVSFGRAWFNHAVHAGIDRSEYFFCFNSYGQLMAWFYSAEDRKELRKHKFRIAIYEVEQQNMTASRKQAVFIRDRARLIKRIPIPK
jgi:hypothetical protein